MYASANLGDTAVQEVIMASLRSRRPNVEFVGMSHDADDIVRTHGIPGFPASGQGVLVVPGPDPAVTTQPKVEAQRGEDPPTFSRRLLALRNIYRQMRDLDMLIISGGGQIDDFWGGPWRQPFRLFAWCACATLQSKPVAWLAVGVDDLGNPISVWFIRHALKMARYRSFRDSGSLEALRKLGLAGEATVCPDPAFGFCSRSERPGARTGNSPKLAVISPIAQSAFQGPSENEYEAYLNTLAAAADTFVQQGLTVRFVCSQIRADPPVAQEVIGLMKEKSAVDLIEVRTVDDFISAVRDAKFVIASRLHASILSLAAGTPVIAISPARKVSQQMIDVGLQDCCLDLKSLQVSLLLDKVQNALIRGDELRELIESRVGELRMHLEAAFDEVVEVIP
jgi:polysaccharide pyruvyl transferase WcaK-like protein